MNDDASTAGTTHNGPRISVIVTARNAGELDAVLADLERQNRKDFEVVQVVGRISIPQAWNLGVQRAKGDIILFTESDCRLGSDWVEKLAKMVERHGFALGAEVITTSRAWSMSCIGIRAQVARSEPFDERFRVCEDTDWFERLAQRGYTLSRQPEPVAYHHRQEVSLRKLWLAFLTGQYWTLIALKYARPAMNLKRIVLGRAFKILREVLILLGVAWGLVRYSHLIPGKLLRLLKNRWAARHDNPIQPWGTITTPDKNEGGTERPVGRR